MRINVLSLLLWVLAVVPVVAAAQGVALSGTMSSAEEGNMEGVLVNAKRAGSNMTVTVVSDDKGRYQFPAAKLEPGKYTLSIRAVGYDMARRAIVDVAAVYKLDTNTGKLEHWQAPPEWNRPNTQINMTSPMNIGVDGKVWAQNNGFTGVHRIELATNKWETWEPYKASPQGHNIYDVISDSQNNGWFTNTGHNHIGRIGAKTGEVAEYLLPRQTNVQRVFVENRSGPRTTFWVGSNHGASIIKLEPLD